MRSGGPVGRQVALPRSVPLPSLNRQQSGCHWRRSGHGGRGPHTAPVCARPPSLGAICATSWRVGAGSLVTRGSCGSRRLGRGGGPCSGSSLGRREGGPFPLPRGGGGRRPRCLQDGGGGGGGVAPRPPCSPSGARPAVPYPGPPLVVGALPPSVRVRLGSRGRPGGSWDEGRPVDRSPGGSFRPETSLCPPRVGNGHGGGHGGRGPHTVLVRRRVPPPGLVRAPFRRSGLGLPVGGDPRGSRRLGALGRAVCRSSRTPSPPRRGPFWGRGGVPSAPGGRRVAPVAFKLGGGAGGGEWGGRSAPSRPPSPSGVGLPSVVSGAPPRGILVPWGLPGGRGRRARPGRPPMGQCGGGWREGGETPSPWFAPPPSPGRPLKGPFCLRRPGRRRSAVGRQRAGRERAGGSPGALAAAAVPPHPGCSGLFRGGCGAAFSSVCLRLLLGLRGRGGGDEGGPLVPWRRPLMAEGGRRGGPGPGGQPSAGGSHSSPAPFYLEPDPRAGPRWGPWSPPLSLRGAGRPGAAVRVSGQRLAGCGAVGSPPRSLSPPSLPRELARAPPSRRIVRGAWVGGPSSPPHSLASAVWAVTCAAACVGAGAVAVAGCAGGSASG